MRQPRRCCIDRLLITLAVLFLPAAESTAQPLLPSCRAEWLPATEVLLHTPGEELFAGVIHPAAALFERPFSTSEAIEEHQRWQAVLSGFGLRVHTVRELLLTGTQDAATGATIQGPALERLRRLARGALEVVPEGFPNQDSEQQQQAAYVEATLLQLAPDDLWRIIMLRPRIRLRSTGDLNTGYVATYEIAPVMNLYFARDQMITTAKGIVLGRMNSEQRHPETALMRAALEALQISPLHEVTDPGRLEGGDFLPAGDRVFLGQGLRTNAEAARQLLELDLFGTPEVVLVKDAWQNQEQMHLDTFFNLAGPRLALCAETRLTVDGQGRPRIRDPALTLHADIYRRDASGRYQLQHSHIDFETYLRNTLEFQIIPVSAEDQFLYGVNLLNVGSQRMVGVQGVSDDLKQRLQQAGIDVTWIDFSALTGGYGACHCTTQVLRRSASPDAPAPDSNRSPIP